MTSDEIKDQMSTDAGPIEAPQRRTFLKGSLTAAAAAAGASGLVAAVESHGAEQAEAKQARRRGAEQAEAPQVRRRGGSYELHFSTRNPPRLEDVHKALAQILNHSECTTCGLMGVDVRLLASEPIQVEANVPVQGSFQSR